MKPPEDCSSLDEIRTAIDDLDREVIRLLGRRAGYVRAAAAFKRNETAVRAPDRVRVLLQARRQWASDEGLDPEVVEQIYRTLVNYFVREELAGWRTGGSGPR